MTSAALSVPAVWPSPMGSLVYVRKGWFAFGWSVFCMDVTKRGRCRPVGFCHLLKGLLLGQCHNHMDMAQRGQGMAPAERVSSALFWFSDVG